MTGDLRGFTELLKKEFRREIRAFDLLASMLSISLLLAVLTGLATQGMYLGLEQREALFPLLLWLASLFAATVAAGRLHEPELSLRAIDGLVLSGFPLALVFLAKLVTLTVVVLFGQLISAVVIGGIADIRIERIFPTIILISLAFNVGYGALALLISAAGAGSRLRAALFPIVLLPLCFPILFAALELTAELIVQPGNLTASSWWSVLMLFDIIYLVLSVNLYPFLFVE